MRLPRWLLRLTSYIFARAPLKCYHEHNLYYVLPLRCLYCKWPMRGRSECPRCKRRWHVLIINKHAYRKCLEATHDHKARH